MAVSNLYICHTVYHLLITLLKIKQNDKNSVLLVDSIPNLNSLVDKLTEKSIFEKIFTGSNKDFPFCGKDYSDDFVKEKTKFFKKYDKIYIFNDDTTFGYFLNRRKIKYNLIEDGYNYYEYHSGEEKYRDWMNSHFEDDFPLVRGYSEFCESVECNSKANLPRDSRFEKLVEVSRNDLFNNISEERKSQILDIFPIEKPTLLLRSVLILSQPLFMDKIMKSEEEQIKYYTDLCEKYRWKYQVYFKPHPRDTLKMPKIQGVKFIEKSTPIEVFGLKTRFKFSKAITHSSTAIDFIPFVKEKIILEGAKKKVRE